MNRLNRLAASSAFVIAIAAIGLALPDVLFNASAEEAQTPTEAKAPAVTVIPAKEREVVQTAIVVGSLVPREEVLVGVDLDGYRLTELLAEAGDVVKAGQVLARLSTDTLEVQMAQNASSLARNDAAIAQAKSQIAEAVATETEATAALERGKTLQTKGFASQDALDQRRSAAQTAVARRQAAEQGLDLAKADKALTEAQRREVELRLSKTEIKAPTDGIVLSRTARVGAIVSGAGEPLFRIARDGAIELEAQVPESSLAQMEVGQRVEVTAPGHGDPIPGSVRLVSPKIDDVSRLGTVRISLPANSHVTSGSFARGTVEIARAKGVALPISAIMSAAGTPRTQVVVDGKVETREIKTGISGEGYVQVVSGIEPGELVIARAGSFVRDGDAVTPVETDAQGAKG